MLSGKTSSIAFGDLRLSASSGKLAKLYAPHTPDEPLDDRFVEACQMKDYIEYLADILTVGDLELRVITTKELLKDGKITELEKRLDRLLDLSEEGEAA